MAKKTQLIMIWFLPLIIIGGFFIPLLGFLVLAMMAFFLPLSFFKGRYWCGYLCPRGSFLDIILSRTSLGRTVPKIFARQWFRWMIFIIFVAFLILRLSRTAGNLLAIAMVFVVMCALTTVISIIIGVTTKHRGWCMICPMGTLQDKINKLNKKTLLLLIFYIFSISSGAFSFQFEDLPWGQKLEATSKKLQSEKKRINYLGDGLTYADIVFNKPAQVHLAFSTQSNELAFVSIVINSTSTGTEIKKQFTEKYGDPYEIVPGICFWLGPKKDITDSIYLNYTQNETRLIYYGGEYYEKFIAEIKLANKETRTKKR